MNLLLDTHAVIWFITNDKNLPKKTKELIESLDNYCFISIASYWEIAIKHSLGRLDLNADLEKIFRIIDETGFEIIPITTNHLLKNASLEFHHHDPFDRIIISQAVVEELTIISKDAMFKNYDIKFLW